MSMKALERKSMATTMKAISVNGYGGPEVLKCEEIARPKVGRGQVLVNIKAAGVNPVDWKIRAGLAKEMFPVHFPWTPGLDIAGVVEEAGDGVTELAEGDAVYGMLRPRAGGYAQYVAADARDMAPKPKSIDFIKAASLPLAALVAWQTLIDTAHLEPDQSVLIHGASGGVGHLSVQLAKWKGANVIGTASAKNAQFLKDMGADQVIDYHNTRFEDVVHDADVVLDLIAGDTQERSWQVLKKGGILISTLGIAHPEKATKYHVRESSFRSEPNGKELRQIAQLVDQGILTPVVSTVMPLKDAAKAHELSQTGHVRGKIVLKVGE